MSNSKEILFHIGMPRTGTTTLQRNLFQNTDYFVGMPVHQDGKPDRFWRQAGLAICKPTSPPGIQCVKNKIKTLEENAEAENKRIVISDEMFTSLGSPLYFQEIYANRIKAVASNSAVFLVIRNQQEIIKSRYRQHKVWRQWAAIGLPIGYQYTDKKPSLFKLIPKKVIRFDRWLKYGIATQDHNWFSNLNYYQLYKSYCDILGSDKVFVLFFEDMVKNPEYFSKQLGDILSVDHNVVLKALKDKKNTSKGNYLKRIRKSPVNNGLGIPNFIRLNYHQFIGKGGLDPSVDGELRELIQSTWGSDNKKLSRELGVDLEAKGYLL
ncbi:sulfotransferase domain-containing protein [Solemya velum gill symbiont]|uniref:Sulfotransferase domain-containing protein n=1 Tax=Solemya velum gill symbiont TaxID=2340 RepID=A0A1T2CQ80_SOVGS|nr:sulfotransferase domain-containing protein [Solemya velum gill symbiont]OOY34300.1 hypothetical protein BOV88_10465 [Solemya velum gill symbiont]OOY36950.1 hypothetical protein BOV89_09625 [Solemya velum gill symbiont]OOY40651.1 hypothetical protein BOV90_02855 [Solemya velum gill symbiont]OOY45814.1 hypothetical protein BOV93_12100 [Solemya velum gill symbiont]OOY47871.1 hypothetical protein BOV92_00645 [Solemya velum gill symbiont]